MSPTAWLRAIEVWSPFPKCSFETLFTPEEHVAAIAESLAESFVPEAFSERTVKLAARQCETFPNYYWCCRVLEGAGFLWKGGQP